MKISSYLLFGLLIPLAQAQQLAPDVLVKSITDLHGGTATVRSDVGHGTTVTLVFPAKDSSESGT